MPRTAGITASMPLHPIGEGQPPVQPTDPTAPTGREVLDQMFEEDQFPILINRLAEQFQAGLNGGGGSGAGRANFNLRKSVRLEDLALQRKELERQRRTGIRDIGQNETEALKNVVNNALQRGIFRSGIREANQQRVQREAGEARTDLQERIQIALDRLANERRGVEGQQYDTGGGGGGYSASTVTGLFEALRILADKGRPTYG